VLKSNIQLEIIIGIWLFLCKAKQFRYSFIY
jgi:hypothetical protein